ncbi:MAG: hypothetical protein Q7R95_07185, partial [bacterium]|nr:hypothetical protein [bacterium]
MTKNRKFQILAIIFGLLFASFIAEIALRIVFPDLLLRVENADFKDQPILKISNLHGVDERGFNNKIALNKADIVAIGDSHTYGITNGASWPKYLSEFSGKIVYGIGMGGFGPAQYYHFLDTAIELDPDIIILGLYTGNDAWDTYRAVYYTDYWIEFRSDDFIDDEPLTSKEVNKVDVRFEGLRDFMRKYSALYKFTAQQTRILREYIGLAEPRTIGITNWNTDDPDASLKYDDIEKIKTVMWPAHRLRGMNLNDKTVQEGSKIMFNFFDEIYSKTKENNIKLIFVFIPTKQMAYAKLAEDRLNENQYYKGIVENEIKFKNTVNEYCNKRVILCHDLLPDIQEALDGSKQLYSESLDDHPIADGYEVYAESIYNFL